MNIRLLKAEWGPERNGTIDYEVRALVGSVRYGEVIGCAYRALEPVHHENPSDYRRYVEDIVHREVGMTLMKKLLEDFRG